MLLKIHQKIKDFTLKNGDFNGTYEQGFKIYILNQLHQNHQAKKCQWKNRKIELLIFAVCPIASLIFQRQRYSNPKIYEDLCYSKT